MLSGGAGTIDVSSLLDRISIYQMCALNFLVSFFESSADIHHSHVSAEFGFYLINCHPSLRFHTRGHQTHALSKTVDTASQPVTNGVTLIQKVGSSTP